jgi:hypothetical protein
MKATLRGQVTGPVCALVGVWDPLLPGHFELLNQLRESATAQGRTPLVVLLDPDPGVLRFGVARWPSYFDLDTRSRLIEQTGCAVAVATFSGRGLQSSAAEFLRALRVRIDLQELWLGARQPLGPGASGSPETVARLADRFGLRIVRLPENDHHATAASVRRLVAAGQIRAAIQKIGRPPTFVRPGSRRLLLGWPCGMYRVVLLRGLGTAVGAAEVHMTPEADGRAAVEWPQASATHIAFVAGPRDCDIPQKKEVKVFQLNRERLKHILSA